MNDTPDSNVVPFQPARRATVPAFPGDEPCDGCAPDCGRPCDITEGSTPNPATEVEWEDLAYTAERFIKQYLATFDWSCYRNAANLMYDESDAATVIRLMKQARFEVHCG